jgi:hypothetical protein
MDVTVQYHDWWYKMIGCLFHMTPKGIDIRQSTENQVENRNNNSKEGDVPKVEQLDACL